MPKIDYNKLLDSISIAEVARRLGMELRQETPTQAKALCPFHDDKTPSLHIDFSRNNGRQHFYCFACGAHGDAIDLVKEQLNVGFKEAVEWLAPGSWSTVGIKNTDKAKYENISRRDSGSGLELAYRLYKTGEKSAQLRSWINERNLNEIVLHRAGYVYAPRNFLSEHLASQKDTSQRREQAGLLEDAHLVRKFSPGVKANYHLPINDRYADFFIDDRIIFPIHDQYGRLLGLGGRSIERTNVSKPKYQFTPGFPKAKVLYRAEFAFKKIQSESKLGKKNLRLYLCEGFFDALRFESLGLPAVAVMGNKISDQQVQLLRALGDSLKDDFFTVVVCFDRDEAGLRGAADTCLKLLGATVECQFLWPIEKQLVDIGLDPAFAKDPNDYLLNLSSETAHQIVELSSYPPELAVLADAFGVSAEDTLNYEVWKAAPRSRRYRAFSKAFSSLKRLGTIGTEALLQHSAIRNINTLAASALGDWIVFVSESTANISLSHSEEFLDDNKARLNHARILAYMGSKRGELPCDEPRWERLDVAATVFNAFLVSRLGSSNAEPIGPYDAVWVPRTFGGDEPRLKMMPKAEDLIIQQYLLNEILTERWDHQAFTKPFSKMIPAVRYYREERKTITTGFNANGSEWGEIEQTLSFAYQIDMDVLEGRQPATEQGMYRPFSECWREFMKSLSDQAADIGYVYTIRLDAKRYYDRLRKYVVRDRLLSPLKAAIGSVTGDTPQFAELLNFESVQCDAGTKAATVLDRIDEQLFGVSYRKPDTGLEDITKDLIGIPQGPVLSAWIGSLALFPVDEEAYRFMDRLNAETKRVGYARYVDDIVLLADSQSALKEMREAIDRCARKLELVLIPKADEIPAMSAEDFYTYINEGRALAVSGPAWEPPLVGDGESGWDFWSIGPTTDRQSALHLLHNVELYKASPTILLQTVRTAFQAPDLRATELSKAARLIWYSIACEQTSREEVLNPAAVWEKYMQAWGECQQGASWQLQPAKNVWESPWLFALEGLERLFDTMSRDVAVLSAEQNSERRKRILWLAKLALDSKFRFSSSTSFPSHQAETRFNLVLWKARRIASQKEEDRPRLDAERSKLVHEWRPFEWLHEAIALLSDAKDPDNDPLQMFFIPAKEQMQQQRMIGEVGMIFRAMLPDEEGELIDGIASDEAQLYSAGIALQILVSILPREQLLRCLSRRPRLIWEKSAGVGQNFLTLPPLPGLSASQLFCCLSEPADENGFVIVNGIEIIKLESKCNSPTNLSFVGGDGRNNLHLLSPKWIINDNGQANTLLVRMKADLAGNPLRLRERVETIRPDVSAADLKQAATIFRAVAQIVMNYAQDNEGKELVPGWPYIATDISGQFHYLIGDGVSRSELGNRAFIRDGGRALRTIEVPIFEAHLWRVGIAVSDYLGLHDDVIKFSSAEHDFTLDSAAVANPARYVLRSQLRKLRGAYADSNTSKRFNNGILPASVERSLALLESFPDVNSNSLDLLFYVLAAEAESAGMYLSIRERWECNDIAAFLQMLSKRVIERLSLSIGQALATNNENDRGLRRDFFGLLCLARQLFSAQGKSPVADCLAWRAMCAGVVCTGISIALNGLLASMRSHGAFERYVSFDFPSDWDIPVGISSHEYLHNPESIDAESSTKFSSRESLIEQLRRLVQHLGHRLYAENDTSDQLSNQVIEKLKMLTKTALEIESLNCDQNLLLEWPFTILSDKCLDFLNLELLETVAVLVKEIDRELGFEVTLVIESSYGYNAKTRRFTDSRSGVCEVNSWMITQFPHNARNIEEINIEGRFQRVWSEIFDRKTGKLLSVAALGEPFASIVIKNPELDVEVSKGIDEVQSISIELVSERKSSSIPAPNTKDEGAPYEDIAISIRESSSASSKAIDRDSYVSDGVNTASEFRKVQMQYWNRRGESDKRGGHVRVALLQGDFGLTYTHPMVETNPLSWPFDSNTKDNVFNQLKADSIYESLLNATVSPDAVHLWKGLLGSVKELPSWAEHRRRRILSRVIDVCEEFGVDLLVLPEYSVRVETVDWLKGYLAKKELSVLAGTYMEFRQQAGVTSLAASMKLLWPVPRRMEDLLASNVSKQNSRNKEAADYIRRGTVLDFSRDKKYRSIPMEEFFRPSLGRLGPLFVPGEIYSMLQREIKIDIPPNVLSDLLTNTRLPLKHFLELICSEVFLVSSPANYMHMYDDLKAIRRRFGDESEPEEVFNDVKALSGLLGMPGDGIHARRSILAVPAASSRSADYWIAGQANFLAAGTTTVFCNSADKKNSVGGSCFIGKGSWKSDNEAIGYISKVTPYHGWSKGIYYNSKKDALSEKDQAVVIADIDPYNMLEGRPRAQTMPSPLQLVAYLPISVSVNWCDTEKKILQELGVAAVSCSSNEKIEGRDQDENEFWDAVEAARVNPNEEKLSKLWSKFPDAGALVSREKAHAGNGNMQPAGPSKLLSAPALYDWIDVSLTLTEQQQLPKISVPPWTNRKE